MHLYGFIRADQVEAAAAMEPGPVRFVAGPEIAAVVADGSGGLSDTLRAHHQTLARLSGKLTVIPVSAGTEVAGESDLSALLVRERERLVRLLETFDGCVEANLKAVYFESPVMAEVLDGLQRPADTESVAAKVQWGETIKGRLEVIVERDVARCLAALADVVLDHRLGPREDWTWLNAGFLLRRDAQQAFEERLEAINEEEAGRSQFRLIMPIPPYSFVADRGRV